MIAGILSFLQTHFLTPHANKITLVRSDPKYIEVNESLFPVQRSWIRDIFLYFYYYTHHKNGTLGASQEHPAQGHMLGAASACLRPSSSSALKPAGAA